MDIRAIHKRVFEYLYDYKLENDVLFMPRINNTKGRLEKGYYFIGDDNYLQVSFWDSRDWKEKIHNISFVILSDGNSYIEFSGRDDQVKALFLRKLVNRLKEFSKLEFNEIYENKWNAHYSTNNYIENLESFLTFEKLIIDEYIMIEENSHIKFIDESKFNRIISKIIKINPAIKDEVNKRKKQGSYLIRKSEYTMNLFHKKLQNDIYDYLKNSLRYTSVVLEKNYVDIIGYNHNGNIEYYEVKPFNPKLAIRNALGQLLEYSHYPTETRSDKMIVASYIKPKAQDINYIKFIRDRYNMEIYYVYYDYNTKTLSEEY